MTASTSRLMMTVTPTTITAGLTRTSMTAVDDIHTGDDDVTTDDVSGTGVDNDVHDSG